jgi:hypothetical protein
VVSLSSSYRLIIRFWNIFYSNPADLSGELEILVELVPLVALFAASLRSRIILLQFLLPTVHQVINF